MTNSSARSRTTPASSRWSAEAFGDPDEDVRQSIARIKASPFVPHKDSLRRVRVFDVATGKLNEVERCRAGLGWACAPDVRAQAQGVLRLGRRSFEPGQLLCLWLIVNRTPDSFFTPADLDESVAMERVHQVIADCADIVDIGGVPAAPGQTVDVGEEIRRTAGSSRRYVRPIGRGSSARIPAARGRGGRFCAAGADLIND